MNPNTSTDLTVTVNGYQLSCRTFGNPQNPPLFLIHGLQQAKEGMAEIATALCDDYYVITYDALGHGQSDKPASFTLADQAQTLNGLVAAMGYEQADILGESMGSYIAAQAAIFEPDRPRHLILLVTKAHGKTSSVAAFMKKKGIDPTKVPAEKMLEVVAEALWCPDTSAEVRKASEEINGEQAPLTAEQVAAINASLHGFDLRPDLHKITAPTLVVAGKYDGLNPPPLGQEVAEAIPNAIFEIFQHSGHMLKVEEPQHLVKIIRAFLRNAL